jgi:hypothetical protein
MPEYNLRMAEPGAKVRIFNNELPTKGVLQNFSNYGRKGFNLDSLG